MILQLTAAILIGCAMPSTASNIEKDDVSPGRQWLAVHEMEIATPTYKQVAAAVGEILLVQDADWGRGNGGLGVEMIFHREHRKIGKLPPKYRVMFFLSLALHLNLESNAHFSEEFYEAMAADCGRDMAKKLDDLIKTAGETAAKDPGIVRAKQIRAALGLFLKR